MDTIKELVDRLAKHRILAGGICFLIDHMTKDGATYLYEKARNEALNSYGNRIFVRGSWNLPIIVRTTAITAAYAEATQRRPDTG